MEIQSDSSFDLSAYNNSQLKTVWKNEQAAPDLLQYEEELVAELNELVQNMESLIEKHLNESEHRFRAHLFQIEVNSYLKIRLLKIQKYHRYISIPENKQLSLLSSAEKTFLQDYTKLVDNHFDISFLRYIADESFRNTVDDSGNVSMITPFPDRYVFIHALRDVGEYQLSSGNNEDTDNIEKGSISCVPYRPIKPLLGKFVELI